MPTLNIKVNMEILTIFGNNHTKLYLIKEIIPLFHKIEKENYFLEVKSMGSFWNITFLEKKIFHSFILYIS